jgi:hypothetical protein
MGRVRAAGWTELLDDELLGLLLFVLAGRIVASFTTIAGQTYQISHRSSLFTAFGTDFIDPEEPILWHAGDLSHAAWPPESASPRRDSNP